MRAFPAGSGDSQLLRARVTVCRHKVCAMDYKVRYSQTLFPHLTLPSYNRTSQMG